MANYSAKVRNWAEFQHYKDRAPPWLKLHRGLLDNIDYHKLSPLAAKALPLCWLIASEHEGNLPDVDTLAFRLRIGSGPVVAILAELMDRNFLLQPEHVEQAATPAQPTAEQWGSRHISQKTRIAVWNRDGGCCVWCKSAENVEYDHVIPVSKGGESTEENLQLLCRACNRKKRTRVVATPAQPDAKHAESRGRGEREVEKEKALSDKSLGFDAFWKAYPNKKGKAAAEKAWKSKRLGLIAERILADVQARIKGDPDWKRGYVPHGSTYVQQERWQDAIAPDGIPTAGPPVAGNSPAKVETAQSKHENHLTWLRQQMERGAYTPEQYAAELQKATDRHRRNMEAANA